MFHVKHNVTLPPRELLTESDEDVSGIFHVKHNVTPPGELPTESGEEAREGCST